MKLSISLSEEDVAAVDEYARTAGLPSRSAVVQRAISLLALTGLEDDYAEAWDEWEASGEAMAWEAATPDGVVDAPR